MLAIRANTRYNKKIHKMKTCKEPNDMLGIVYSQCKIILLLPKYYILHVNVI